MIRTEVLTGLYGHQVEVLRVHGRIVVVAGDADPGAGHHDHGPPGPVVTSADRHALAVRTRVLRQPTGTHRVRRSAASSRSCPRVVGVFTVLRGQSFAGHALTDVSTAGGSAAFLLGISPLLGFVGVGLIGAGTIDAIGIQRVKGRDLATGIVLGAATGLAALLLYYDTTTSATTGATQTILFGSIFTIDPSTIPIVIACSVIAVAIIAVLYRPLLLASTSNELAAARGVPVRLIGLGFMAALAVAVGLSALAIGAILSTALLIGPAATALRLTNRTGAALVIAAVIGVGRHLARGAARLRQLLLGLGPQRATRSASSSSPSPSSRTSPPDSRSSRTLTNRRPPRQGDVFSSFMTNTWIVATIVAVIAGVVGFFVVLRGSAFPAHALPNSAFAGAAAANLLGISALIGLGAFAGSPRSRSRRSVAAAATTSPPPSRSSSGSRSAHCSSAAQQEYEPQLYSLLFGEVLGVSTTELLPVALLAVASIAAIVSPLPAAAVLLRDPRHRRSQRRLQPPHRTGVPARARRRHRPHRPRRRRPADLLTHDRPTRRRPLLHQPTPHRDRPVGDHRPDHRLDRDRRLLPDQLADRILRRHPQRPRLHTRTNLGRLATHPHHTPPNPIRTRHRHNLNPPLAELCVWGLGLKRSTRPGRRRPAAAANETVTQQQPSPRQNASPFKVGVSITRPLEVGPCLRRSLLRLKAAHGVDLPGRCDLELEGALRLVGGRVHLTQPLGQQRDLANESAARPRPPGAEQQLRGVTCRAATVPAALIPTRPANRRRRRE